MRSTVADVTGATATAIGAGLVQDRGAHGREQHLGGERRRVPPQGDARREERAGEFDHLCAPLAPLGAFGLAQTVLVAVHEHRQRRPAAKEVEHARDERRERLLAAAPADGGPQLHDQHVERLQNGRVEELLLGRKVEVERTFANAGSDRDVLDGNRVELTRREHVGRRAQDLLALGALYAAAGHRAVEN